MGNTSHGYWHISVPLDWIFKDHKPADRLTSILDGNFLSLSFSEKQVLMKQYIVKCLLKTFKYKANLTFPNERSFTTFPFLFFLINGIWNWLHIFNLLKLSSINSFICTFHGWIRFHLGCRSRWGGRSGTESFQHSIALKCALVSEHSGPKQIRNQLRQ